MPEQPTYVRVTARALRELTEAVNAANLDVAKLHHRLTADGCYVPDHPLYEPLALHGPLSWTDDLAKAFAAPTDDLVASLRDVVGARLNADGSATAIMRSYRGLETREPPPDVLESLVSNLRIAGPVVTAAFVDGRMKVFHDGAPAHDSPWQHAFDLQQHEADRVMVRAVSPLRVLLPSALSEHTRTFVLDAASTGHRAPFQPGDLVVQAAAFDAVQRVLEVADDVEGTFCREIHLIVKRADVVVDNDAF